MALLVTRASCPALIWNARARRLCHLKEELISLPLLSYLGFLASWRSVSSSRASGHFFRAGVDRAGGLADEELGLELPGFALGVAALDAIQQRRQRGVAELHERL